MLAGSTRRRDYSVAGIEQVLNDGRGGRTKHRRVIEK